MKKAFGTLLTVWVLLSGSAGAGLAAEATAGADIVSAYVWRGITFNDGLVVQPYVDVAAGNGLAINVWGNYDGDDYDRTLDDNEFSEVDLTLSYAFSFEPVEVTAGHIAYLFPNGGPGTSELFVDASVPLPAGFSVGLAVYYDYDEVDDYYLSASLSYDLELDSGLELGAGASAGYAGEDFSSGPDDGFHEYTLSLNAAYPVAETIALSAFVAYTDTLDTDVLPERKFARDVEVYGGGGLSWSF